MYSIQLSVDKSLTLNQKSNVFNLENVNKLLSKCNQPISVRAAKFKNLFELYNKNPHELERIKNQGGLQWENFFKAFNFSNTCELFKKLDFKKELMNSESQSSENFNESFPLSSTSSNISKKVHQESLTNKNSLDLEPLKTYINKKFLDMKEDILKEMELKVNEIREENNFYFNKIILALNDMNINSNTSFLKVG